MAEGIVWLLRCKDGQIEYWLFQFMRQLHLCKDGTISWSHATHEDKNTNLGISA